MPPKRNPYAVTNVETKECKKQTKETETSNANNG